MEKNMSDRTNPGHFEGHKWVGDPTILGPFPQQSANERAKYQPICEGYMCKNAAQILWKDVPSNSCTWEFHQCDVCLSFYCSDCAPEGDENGHVQCYDCYETGLHRE